VGLTEKFRPHLKGVLPLSGVYDVAAIEGFKQDPRNASPVTHITSGVPPFLITYCEWDYPYLPAQARSFDDALRKAGNASELVYVRGENHITEIVDVTKDDDQTALAILGFIQKHP
jgi:acetyl esterase/lipase